MQQILLNSQGALIARMPRPVVSPGEVLVRVHYSLISTGTEIAALRPRDEGHNTLSQQGGLAFSYLGKAVRHPRKAARRVAQMAYRQLRRAIPTTSQPVPREQRYTEMVHWHQASALEMHQDTHRLELLTDSSEFAYQATTDEFSIPDGLLPLIDMKGSIEGSGLVSIGLLADGRDTWLGNRNYDAGVFEDSLIFPVQGSKRFSIVIANGGNQQQAKLILAELNIRFVPPMDDGLPQSELEQQGWNVGYSAAGEIIAVGAGVHSLAAGDFVACAGAGKANHADFIAVPHNLVCKIPNGCDLQIAATTTVGAIALQGVRRAEPQLGETICVLGLGLIGQITAQLLKANGVKVLGLDLNIARLDKAKALGLTDGSHEIEAFKRIVRDYTGGHGADRVLITAATKSDVLINLSMELARRKGLVVIVGDVGLHVQRAIFYRKEIDLRMSTSYGPGRYDPAYEEEGQDYPYAYVRWTLNRNMQAYLDLAASGQMQLAALIERIVSIHDAPAAYADLVSASASPPLAVLLKYIDPTKTFPDTHHDACIHVRGARRSPQGPLRYALIGAGAFGTSMLVPQMKKRNDRFFLRGVVSRNTTTGGNFARSHQVEILTTDLNAVLADPDFDLVVIATRHHEHADQVIRSLEAGKHIFVEKPLATTWNDLDRVIATYQALEVKPLLMVGFNRRFSPAMQTLQQIVKDRRGPLFVQYRVNAGYIALDSWIQDAKQGAGRNIGEACHFYDCFRFLTGAPVVAIDATSIDPGSLPYLRNDNFSATLRYADGSVCVLLYTALGPKEGLPKERMELFCDGEAYLLDDYKHLVQSRTGAILWESDVADKGHYEELSQMGDRIAHQMDAPISFDELIETSALALYIEDLILGRE